MHFVLDKILKLLTYYMPFYQSLQSYMISNGNVQFLGHPVYFRNLWQWCWSYLYIFWPNWAKSRRWAKKCNKTQSGHNMYLCLGIIRQMAVLCNASGFTIADVNKATVVGCRTCNSYASFSVCL